MSESADIDDIVHRHARAVVAMDIGQLMHDLTPEAMGKIQARVPGDVAPALRGYEVLAHRQDGSGHVYDVRYVGRTSFVIRARWSRMGGGWKVVDAEVIATEPT
jgi:hypothetical protein